MTSLDFPVSAPLVNHQNQLRFWGLSFASVSNTNNSPVATRNHSRCLLPFAKVMAQLCFLQAFISCSPHCLHTDRHRHMVTLHIRAGRTWHVWELTERSVLPDPFWGLRSLCEGVRPYTQTDRVPTPWAWCCYVWKQCLSFGSH